MKRYALPLLLIIVLLLSVGCPRNRPPEVPDKPTGPVRIAKGITGEYRTSAADPNKDDIQYIFDWGDGKTDTTKFVKSESIATASHAWTDTGKFQVKAKAKDIKGAVSRFSEALEVTVVDPAGRKPPKKPIFISGPSTGFKDSAYTFSFKVEDEDNDSVTIKISWGDGDTLKFDSLRGPSGTIFSATHTYRDTGTYKVVAIAKDVYQMVSIPSDTLRVRIVTTMPLGAILWSVSTEEPGEDIHSSPAIDTAAGVLYVGCVDGYVYAIDINTGRIKWKYPPEAGDGFNSSPAIGQDGTIYIGGIDKKVHAIKPDGTRKWVFDGGDEFNSSPAIGGAGDGKIYIGCDDGYLYALNPDGRLAWKDSTGAPIQSSPAIDRNGNIIFGNDSGMVYAISPAGDSLWAFGPLGAEIVSSPAIGRDGKIYFGLDSTLYVLNSDGTLNTSFIASGADEILSSPVIGTDGSVYFTTAGRVWRILNNVVTYESHLVGEFSSITIARDTLYALAEDNILFALKLDGSEAWRTILTGGSFGNLLSVTDLVSSPTLCSKGIIYVACENGIFAVYARSPLANSDWPKFRHDHKNTGRFGGPVP